MNILGRKTLKGRTTSAPKTAKTLTAEKTPKAEKTEQATAVGTPNTSAVSPTGKPISTRDEIARRAYEIYLARGGAVGQAEAAGQAEEDWLAAERELGI